MRKHTPSRWLTLLAACFGLLMLYIDLFIVNVALPTIGQDLHAPLSTVSWTISGYALMIGVLPMAGFMRSKTDKGKETKRLFSGRIEF